MKKPPAGGFFVGAASPNIAPNRPEYFRSCCGSNVFQNLPKYSLLWRWPRTILTGPGGARLAVRLNRSYGYAFASTAAPDTTSPAPALARLMQYSG